MIGKGGGRIEFEIMNALYHPPPSPTPTESMVEIKGEGNGSGEKSAISEAKRACACTTTHSYLSYLSSSKMMGYINETTPGDRYVKMGGGKGVTYINTLPPQPPPSPGGGGILN